MPPGRPSTERETDQTRVYADQVRKLRWLWRLRSISSSEFIGSRIEADLDAEFEKIRQMVERLEADMAASEAADEPFANDLGNPVG